MMALIADILLVAGALSAAFYCMVLSWRLRRFNDLEKGMGGAIAVLSAQVDDMTRALEGARNSAHHSSTNLLDLTDRAEGVSQRLEMLVASLHDLPLGEDVQQERPAPQPKKAHATATQTGAAPATGPESAHEQDAPLTFIRSTRAVEEAAKSDPLVLRNQKEDAE